MTTLQRISITVVTALVLGTLRASAGELPQYEFAGFPISPVQITVLGLDGVQERAPTPTLTLNGMPASPHQIAVIHPRSKEQIAKQLNKDQSGISAQTTIRAHPAAGLAARWMSTWWFGFTTVRSVGSKS
jgi:hypothetical protein